jgi:hypothetical protein
MGQIPAQTTAGCQLYCDDHPALNCLCHRCTWAWHGHGVDAVYLPLVSYLSAAEGGDTCGRHCRCTAFKAAVTAGHAQNTGVSGHLQLTGPGACNVGNRHAWLLFVQAFAENPEVLTKAVVVGSSCLRYRFCCARLQLIEAVQENDRLSAQNAELQRQVDTLQARAEQSGRAKGAAAAGVSGSNISPRVQAKRRPFSW